MRTRLWWNSSPSRRFGAALVEAGGHDRAVHDHRPDGFVQGAVASAQLDGGVDAAAGPGTHDRTGASLGVGGDGLDGAHRARDVEPAGQHVDGDHVGAARVARRAASRPMTP